ncbi:Ig-like domain-containing protein [Taibaiella soli]|nr:T9SS type A sorting domain-containing protein [Taibaiella soli]
MAKFYTPPLTRRSRSCPTLWGALLILIASLGFSFSSFAQSASATLQQAANGKLATPVSPVVFQNGNLNTNNSHYVEGQSVPYQLLISNVTPGDTLTITLQYDITHNQKYALDFITGPNWLQPHNFASHKVAETVDGAQGTTFANTTPSDYLQVTQPLYLNTATTGAANAKNSFNNINGGGTKNNQNSLTLWGGTFGSNTITYSYNPTVLVLSNSDESVSFTVKVVPSGTTAVLSWGGHISKRTDWGSTPVLTAGGISGSPYHMRRISWNLGQLGNSDMQMQIALAGPICPGDLTTPSSTCVNSSGVSIPCPISVCAGSTLYYKVTDSAGATTYKWTVTPSTGVTIANPTSQMTAITFANSGAYTIWDTLSNASGILTACSTPLTINPAPVCSITGTDTICSGGTSSFTAATGMDSYSWTGPNGFTASTASTGTISVAGTYSVTVTKNGCSSSCQKVLVVNPGSNVPTTTPDSTCGPGQVTLRATGSANCDTLIWFSDQALNNRVTIGSSYTTTLTATKPFYVICRSKAGCMSAPATVTGIVNQIPPAPTTMPDSTCGPGIVHLTANGSASCTSLLWYTDSARTSALQNTGSTFNPNLTATTIYWVACKTASGCMSASTPVKGTVNSIPPAPTTTPDSTCGPGIVHLTASGSSACASLLWYTDSARTSALQNTGSTYNPNISSTSVYWVACKTSSGCVSASTPVKGTVNTIPPAPTTTPDSSCGPGIVHLTANGSAACTSLLWYTDSARTSALQNTGSTFNPSLTATTKYWVACKTSSGCMSASTPVSGIINAIPPAPTTTPDSTCGPGIVHLTANGSSACASLLWYTDSARTSALQNTGSTYNPSISSTSIYWVACKTNSGCISASTPVKGTVNSIPPAPTTTPDSTCGPGIVHLTANGSSACASLLWYTDSARTSALQNTGSTYNPNISSTSVYWVACKTSSGCVSASTPVKGTVNTIPPAPTTTPDSSCGPGIVHLTANGSAACTSLLWYTDSARTSALQNTGSTFNPSLTATTKYWVACKTSSGCISASTPVSGIINTTPPAPTTTPDSTCGPGIVHLTANGSSACASLLWYTDSARTSALQNTGSTFNPSISSTSIYWVACKTASGCISASTPVKGTVNSIPPAPTTTPDSTCGPGIVHLTASGSSACASLLWYTDSARTSALQNTGSTYNPSLTSTKIYWVACKTASGCLSASTPVKGTVNAIPPAPTTTPDSSCGPGIVHLTANGSSACASLLWYTDSARTSALQNTGSTFSPSLTATTKYWVACKTSSGCISASTPVSGIINTIPPAPSTTPDSTCGPGIVHLTANGSSACASLLWYTDSARTSALQNTGGTFNPSISSTSIYWVACKTASGCISASTPVKGTVNSIPPAPTTTPDSSCGPGIVHLTANGSAVCASLLWYTDSARTSALQNTGSTFNPSLTATAIYWVACKTASGCVSASTPVKGTINTIPPAPTTTPDSTCGPGIVHLTANGSAACTSLLWYTDSARTSALQNTGSTYNPSLTATTIYWVACKTSSGCISASTPVKGIVNSIPPAPSTTPDSSCGPGIVHLTANGSAACTSLLWYTDSARTSALQNTGSTFNPSLTATTIYWVACKTASGCVSASTPVKGIINSIPAAPTTTSDSNCGPGIVHLTANGSNACASLLWYPDSARTGTLLNTGSTYNPSLTSTTIYWVACKTSSGCVSASTSVKGIINTIPNAPTVTPTAHCGRGSTAMFALGSLNCDSLIWFSDAGTNIRVNVGSSYSPTVSSTTTYYVLCKSLNGCRSLPTPITDTAYPVPQLQMAHSVDVCAGKLITLIASPTGGNWTSPLLGSLSGGVFNSALVVKGTYKVYYSITNQYGCAALDSVNVNVKDCGFVACSYTQGYYGGNGKACDGVTLWTSPTALINHLLATNLIIGSGPKTILIPIGAGATVNAVMPGGSTPRGLVYTGQCNISTVSGSCFQTNYLTKQGRINNVLLSQTIALALNGRMKNGILLTVPIQQGTLVTQGISGGCGDSISVGPCGTGTAPLSSSSMNSSVVNYLTANGTVNASVADLLALANAVLGGALTPGSAGANNITVPSYSDVSDAVSFINQTFDECDAYVGYNCSSAVARGTAPTSVTNSITAGQFTVYPNPTSGMFTVESPVNMTNTVITVLDLNGRVVAKQNVAATGHTVFNLQNVTSGVYVINISDGKETFHVKLMVL